MTRRERNGRCGQRLRQGGDAACRGRAERSPRSKSRGGCERSRPNEVEASQGRAQPRPRTATRTATTPGTAAATMRRMTGLRQQTALRKWATSVERMEVRRRQARCQGSRAQCATAKASSPRRTEGVAAFAGGRARMRLGLMGRPVEAPDPDCTRGAERAEGPAAAGTAATGLREERATSGWRISLTMARARRKAGGRVICYRGRAVCCCRPSQDEGRRRQAALNRPDLQQTQRWRGRGQRGPPL